MAKQVTMYLSGVDRETATVCVAGELFDVEPGNAFMLEQGITSFARLQIPDGDDIPIIRLNVSGATQPGRDEAKIKLEVGQRYIVRQPNSYLFEVELIELVGCSVKIYQPMAGVIPAGTYWVNQTQFKSSIVENLPRRFSWMDQLRQFARGLMESIR